MESILIENKNKLTIKGATKILSSTKTQAVVEINENNLIVSGEEIEVTKLDLENKVVEFNGSFNSIKITNKKEKQNLLKRIFK